MGATVNSCHDATARCGPTPRRTQIHRGVDAVEPVSFLVVVPLARTACRYNRQPADKPL
jgi:hypothetical protein